MGISNSSGSAVGPLASIASELLPMVALGHLAVATLGVSMSSSIKCVLRIRGCWGEQLAS